MRELRFGSSRLFLWKCPGGLSPVSGSRVASSITHSCKAGRKPSPHCLPSDKIRETKLPRERFPEQIRFEWKCVS
ncbi:hypothetical protein RISK_000016 [Rhodopirellula islandica]|uniref:Uncharacterized protein n=1 Tax=Rhodopirellula islandica TaxID=595434 RepID=A0A0J1BMW9_RHOIS|nr:hypothetical protein RISK_000016 [Rhodopirellula islandica]